MPRAQINKTYLTSDYYENIKSEDLNKIHRQLAKAANQRMVRLERAKSNITGQDYTFGAYKKAQKYLQSAYGTNAEKLRFKESINLKGMTNKQIASEIMKLQTFLNSPSSTVKGLRAIENKRVETFKKMGISESVAKDPRFYEFLNSKAFDVAKGAYDSSQIVDFYRRASNAGATPKDIQDAFDRFIDLEDGQHSIKELNRLIESLIPDSSN